MNTDNKQSMVDQCERACLGYYMSIHVSKTRFMTGDEKAVWEAGQRVRGLLTGIKWEDNTLISKEM